MTEIACSVTASIIAVVIVIALVFMLIYGYISESKIDKQKKKAQMDTFYDIAMSLGRINRNFNELNYYVKKIMDKELKENEKN